VLLGNEFPPRQHPALPASLSSYRRYHQPRANSSLAKEDTGNNLDLVNKPVTVAQRSNGVLEAAFMQLLGADRCFCEQHNPTVNKASGVTIQNDGIHVDLSQEFTTGGAVLNEQSRSTSSLYSHEFTAQC